jgi:hypothetical protein
MGTTEEGTIMSDENKNKAGSPGIKVMGLFYFAKGLIIQLCFLLINLNIVFLGRINYEDKKT